MWIDFLLKPTCIFCNDLSHRKIDLCSACERDLPVLQNYCQRCAQLLPNGQVLCGACLGDTLLDIKITALFYYQTPVDKLITSIKFGNNLIGAKIFGELLASHLNGLYQYKSIPEIIIPMPLHPNRLRERGYNQALEIARPIAKKLLIPIDKHSVLRLKNTSPQAKLPAKARAQNIKKAFFVDDSFSYTHVAIIDDIITTGNTINELCQVLAKSGVMKIDVWCVAKS